MSAESDDLKLQEYFQLVIFFPERVLMKSSTFFLSLVLLIGFLCLGVRGSAQDLASSLDQLIQKDPVARRSNLALRVVDLEDGTVLFDQGGDKLFTPASNLKIYTSSCALDKFGPDHTFTTGIALEGFQLGSSLKGSLVLRGGGDPMFNMGDLQALAATVSRRFAVEEITDGIVVDESLFQVPLKGPGWMWDDDPDVYNMSISAMMMDFNVLQVLVSPGEAVGELGEVSIIPPAVYPPVIDQLRTTRRESDYIATRESFNDYILVRGRISINDEPSTVAMTMHNPSRWVGEVFREMLERQGVSVGGEVRISRYSVGGDAVASSRSVPLSKAIRHFNKTSENAVGEMLLLHLAMEEKETPTSWSQGATVISKWLVETAGLEEGSFRLVDGSGLSRYNLISAKSSTDLLSFMWKHSNKGVFLDSLPIYSVRLDDDVKADRERVFAKPGGMTGVSTISGYIHTLDDRWLAISFLANGYIGSNEPVIELRNKIFDTLVQGD